MSAQINSSRREFLNGDMAGLAAALVPGQQVSWIGRKSDTANEELLRELGSCPAGSITGVTITGATIQTATSGARVVLTSANGLQVYDASNNLVFQAAPGTYSEIALAALQAISGGNIDIWPALLNQNMSLTLHPTGRKDAKIIATAYPSGGGDLYLLPDGLVAFGTRTPGAVACGGTLQIKDSSGNPVTLLTT